jgi:hypothetical protein
MPADERTVAEVRQEIESKRDDLAHAVETLRSGIDEATDVRARLAERLPVATLAAFGVGFVLAGGIHAIVRLALSGRKR